MGLVSGELLNWNEHLHEGLTTVGSQDLFYVQRIETNGEVTNGEKIVHSLVKTKIGLRSRLEERNTLCGIAILGDHSIISLSKNGAVHKITLVQNSIGCISLLSDATKGFICPHCNSRLFRDNFSVQEHISKMHLGPVMCDRCKFLKKDIKSLKEHIKNCFYICGVPGCKLLHKELLIARNHKKKYLNSL